MCRNSILTARGKHFSYFSVPLVTWWHTSIRKALKRCHFLSPFLKVVGSQLWLINIMKNVQTKWLMRSYWQLDCLPWTSSLVSACVCVLARWSSCCWWLVSAFTFTDSSARSPAYRPDSSPSCHNIHKKILKNYTLLTF